MLFGCLAQSVSRLRDVIEPPFSFVYAERQSADLLPTWTFEVKDSEVDATKRCRLAWQSGRNRSRSFCFQQC